MVQSMAAQTIKSNLNCIPTPCIVYYCPPLNGCMKYKVLQISPFFPQHHSFFQIIHAEIGDTKKTISDTWFQL